MTTVAALLVPATQSVPCTTKLKLTWPLATAMSTDAAPAVVRLGASRIRDGSLDVRCTVTPPWAEAPSEPVVTPLCSPAPTGDRVGRDRVGLLTVDVTFPAVVTKKPGIEALTVVVPAARGSNSSPPTALLGVLLAPAAML